MAKQNEIDKINQQVADRISLNLANRERRGAAYAPLTSVSTGAPELKKTFDYIEKWTGENQYLTTPADRINKNFIDAQYNEAKQKSLDQGNWGEFAGFAAQTVAGEIVLGTASGFGYLLDIQHWGSQLMGGEGDWGNWMSDYMDKGKEWIREAAPIYQDPDNVGRTTWQNMLHGDGWWFENGVSVASSLSILIPVAGWSRGVSMLGKGLNYASQGARIGKMGTTAAKGMRTVDKVMDIMPMVGETGKAVISGIHKATVSRLIESQMEATAVFKEKYNYYKDQPGITDEQAKKAASKAAAFTYNWNWGAILTDLPQYMLLGNSGKTMKKWLATKKPGFITNSKLLAKSAGIRSVGFTMASEGAEEAYQYIISEEGKRIGDIQAGLVDPADTTLGDRIDKYTKEAEFQTSALFGALGGGVFAAAGPKATQLINKAFRKGELKMTEADLRVNEAKDRYTRLAHSMDMVNKAVASKDEEAIFTAKSNMAFNSAKDAVLVNNWDQARESILQLKNATPEEQEAYDLKNNFGEFVSNIDEWVTHMDKAADIVDRAKSKYTYGLAEQVAKRQFDKYMYDVQSPKLMEKINNEKKNVIPNFSSISKDGDNAIQVKLDTLGMTKAITIQENILKDSKMPEADRVIITEQIASAKAYVEERKVRFQEFVDASALTKDDKLALTAIEGGTADDLVSLVTKQKLMDSQNEKTILELNYLTSRDGRREFNRQREVAYKEAKAAEKTKKEKEKQQTALDETANQVNNSQESNIPKETFSDTNIAQVAKAMKDGAQIEDLVKAEEVEQMTQAVADYNLHLEQNPNTPAEEKQDELDANDPEALKVVEELPTESVNVLNDAETEVPEDDIEVNPTEDLQAELEAASAHEVIEMPVNDERGEGWRVTAEMEDTKLANIPGQLAWLSANNPEAGEVTDEMKALSAYLESPDSMVTDLEVSFDFNRDWIKAHPSERYTRMMAALQKGIMPADSDVGFMPIQATIMKDGKPVVFKGFTMRLNLHDPSFFYKKDGTPKYKDVSDHQATLAILHKKAIIRQMLNGGTVVAKINGKSNGKLNPDKTDENGNWVKKIVAQTLKTPIAKLKFLVGDKQGSYVDAKKRPRLSLGFRAEPGAIYTEVSTANGSKFPLRLQVDNVSEAEANILHTLYSDLLENPSLIDTSLSKGILNYITNSKDPRISGMTKYLPNLESMTYQELLSHLVYEGSRTIAHATATLTYFVNTESNGVKLPNAVQFGKTKMTRERLVSEKGQAEFIEWVTANKRRQVDAHRLDNEEYKIFLNDNKILSTNVAVTPEGHLFVQPIISYSTDVRVENATSNTEKESVSEMTTKEELLLGLKEDLAYERGEFGNPDLVTKLEAQIAELETKQKPQEVKKESEIKDKKAIDTIKDTIKMFQTGIKTANNEEITVNFPETEEFDENPC